MEVDVASIIACFTESMHFFLKATSHIAAVLIALRAIPFVANITLSVSLNSVASTILVGKNR